jgi:hypothetical protein
VTSMGGTASTPAPSLTYRLAMTRSAWVTLSWAAATCGLSAAAIAAFDLRPARGVVGYLLVGVYAFGGDLESLLVWVPAGALAGAFVGVFGRFAELPPPRVRGVFIWLAFFPASGLGMGVFAWAYNVACAVGLAGSAASCSPSFVEALLSLPGGVLGFLLFALPYFSPLIAVPLVGAAWSVEGATRPLDQPATGQARCRNRVLLSVFLLGVSAAGHAYAAWARSA